MAFYAVVGLTGAGKSLYQISFGCYLANKLRKTIASNIPLDYEALRRYCGMKGYGWLAHCIDRDKIKVLPGADSLEELLAQENSVILLDEAGIFFPARSFQSMNKNVIRDLAQVRKGASDVVWAAQYFEMVDKIFRMLCHRVVHCQGVSTYCPKLRNDKLVIKNYYHFDPVTYEAWLADSKARRPGLAGQIRTRLFYSAKVETGMVKKADIQAFSVFRSFERLDKSHSTFGNPYYMPPFHQVTYDELEEFQFPDENCKDSASSSKAVVSSEIDYSLLS
jgi:hypothetical protein